MRARVRTHIQIEAHDPVWSSISAQVREELTMANPAKEEARREMVYGWEHMNDKIALYDYYTSAQTGKRIVVLPRGYGRRLGALEPDTVFEDNRTLAMVDTSSWKKVSPKGIHQENAIEAICRSEQGIVVMPPGSGKTVAILESIRRLGQRACIIVDKTNIAKQWQQRCEQFLGFTPGFVGDGKIDWAGHDIVIAMQQSLWSKRESAIGGFWNAFGFVCLDECHHAQARTYQHVLQKFPAAWRIGVSATPVKDPAMEPIIRAVLGETVLDAPGDSILDPIVEQVNTDFRFLFWPTHSMKPSGRCGFAYCDRTGRVHRNNYSEMMKAIEEDLDRNNLIATRVVNDILEGRTVLVVSRRKGHLKNISKIVNERMKWAPLSDGAMMLTGDQKANERMLVYTRAELGRCVVFSTIAEEALDIPRLDTVHLAWPTRKKPTVDQIAGRVRRMHPKKKQPKVVDYVDRNVNILLSQAAGRDEFYSERGWNRKT